LDKNEIEVYNRNDPLTWVHPSQDELDIVDIWMGILRNKKVILVLWLSIAIAGLAIGLAINSLQPVTFKHKILLETAHYIKGSQTIPIVDIKTFKKWFETLYLPKSLQVFHKKHEENGVGKVAIKEVSPTVLELTFPWNNNNVAKHTELFDILKNIILRNQKPAIENAKLQIEAELSQLQLTLAEKEGLLRDFLADKTPNVPEKNIRVALFRKEITSLKKLIELTGRQVATVKEVDYKDVLFDPKNKATSKHNYIPLALGIVLGLIVALSTAFVIELNRAVAIRIKSHKN